MRVNLNSIVIRSILSFDLFLAGYKCPYLT